MSSEKRPILLLAKTGFIIRNLLLGTFADTLIQQRPLVVAVPDPQDEQLKAIIRNRPITLIPFLAHREPNPTMRLEKLAIWQSYMYRFKQAEKGTASLELQTRLWESEHSRLGQAVISALIGVGHSLSRLGLMGAVEDSFLSAVGRWPESASWRALISEWQPAAVVSTMLTHAGLHTVSVDLPPVIAAHQLGLPIGTLVQSWDNLSSKTAVLPSWIERFWTWSPYMTQELLDTNPRLGAEQVRTTGSPQFDFHRRDGIMQPRDLFMKSVGLDPTRPYVVLGCGTAKWSPDEPEKVTSLVEALHSRLPDCQVLVRLHPKDAEARWQPYNGALRAQGAVLQVTSPAVHMDHGGFVPPQDFYSDQVNALGHAALVINMASTLTVDAAILDRPIVSIAYDSSLDPKFPEGRAWMYNNSSHFRPLVETGGVRVAYSEEDCCDWIERYLDDPSSDRLGRQRIVEMVAGELDGGSGKRLATEVENLARGVDGSPIVRNDSKAKSLPSEMIRASE